MLAAGIQKEYLDKKNSLRKDLKKMVPPARIELAAKGLGILKSGHIRTDKEK